MKRIAAVSLLVAAGFLTAGSAMAEDHVVKANIPFSFNLNGRTLPAGHYIIESDINSPSLLTIEDRDDSVHVMVMVRPDSNKSQRDNTMEFHRYGNQYFLSALRSSDVSMDCHLTPSKQEKWVKAQTQQDASLRVNDDVMIALK